MRRGGARMTRYAVPLTGAELSRELERQHTRHGARPVEDAVRQLAVVERDEEPRGGGVQSAKTHVRRPGLRLRVELGERLDEDPGRERVVQACAADGSHEAPLVQAHVVAGHEER